MAVVLEAGAKLKGEQFLAFRPIRLITSATTKRAGLARSFSF
jgi:hypothetical protein